jgi:hypothetical protein
MRSARYSLIIARSASAAWARCRLAELGHDGVLQANAWRLKFLRAAGSQQTLGAAPCQRERDISLPPPPPKLTTSQYRASLRCGHTAPRVSPGSRLEYVERSAHRSVLCLNSALDVRERVASFCRFAGGGEGGGGGGWWADGGGGREGWRGGSGEGPSRTTTTAKWSVNTGSQTDEPCSCPGGRADSSARLRHRQGCWKTGALAVETEAHAGGRSGVGPRNTHPPSRFWASL